MPPPQCSLPEFGGRPFDRHKFAFVIPASFGRQLGSGLAEKDRSRRNADRHGQKVQQGKADQSQADQSKPGARRKVATDEAQLGPKGQPPPFEWRIEKIQAGQSSAQRQSAQKSQHRTGARNEVEQEHGQPDGQRKQQF